MTIITATRAAEIAGVSPIQLSDGAIVAIANSAASYTGESGQLMKIHSANFYRIVQLAGGQLALTGQACDLSRWKRISKRWIG